MTYRTVHVGHRGCCDSESLELKIQKVLDQYANSGWVLITAHNQKRINACGGPTAGAILIFGKRVH